MKRIVAVIPAYNEASRIGPVVREAIVHAHAVIVIDDGSTDGTSLAARAAGNKVRVLRHAVNLGKGAALKTGCEAARRMGAEVIVTLDADGQHPPAHIPLIAGALEEGGYGIVFGRRMDGDAIPLIRRAGNRAVNAMARNLFRLDVRDIWCGFRAIRMSDLPRMPWTARDYSGEVQMALNAAKNGVRYGEYPIPAIYSDRAKGVHMLHGLSLLARMALWRAVG